MFPDIPGGSLGLLGGLVVLLALACLLCLTWRPFGNSHSVKLTGLPSRCRCRNFRKCVFSLQELHETDRIAGLPGFFKTAFFVRDFWGWGIVTSLAASLRPSPSTHYAVLRPGYRAASARIVKADSRKHLLLLDADVPLEPLCIAESTAQIEPDMEVLVCGFEERANVRLVQYESRATVVMKGSLCECLQCMDLRLCFRQLDPDTRAMVLELGEGVATEGSPVIYGEEVIGMVSYVDGNLVLVVVAEELQLMLVEGTRAC